MTNSLLEVNEVSAGYGTRSVLRRVSVAVPEGSVVGIIGPNGHGKTTLLRCISGLIPWTGRDIRLAGSSLRGMEASEIVAQGIVHIPQGDLVFAEMTVRDNLLTGAHLLRDPAETSRRLGEVHELFPKLAERSNQITSTLSGGERRMLSIGRGLMTGGRILLVDEPTLGLAPLVKDQIYDVLTNLKQQGRTIIVVEENVSAVLDFADELYLLDHGEFVWNGSPDALEMHGEILETYLGA